MYTHAYIHTYIHTYMHAYIHTCTPIILPSLAEPTFPCSLLLPCGAGAPRAAL